MAKSKLYGVLESEGVLLEPVTETRYAVNGDVDSELVGEWLTIQGTVDGQTVKGAKVTRVEKSTGKVTRSGVIVADAPNLPAEANGAGGFLYQAKKGRYMLLSQGDVNEPIQGDFGKYAGKSVKVSGKFGDKTYILYNVKVTAK